MSNNYSSGAVFVAEVLSLFLNSWFLMLVLGGLADHLQIPELAVSYSASVLLRLASSMLFNQIPVKRDLAWTAIIKGRRS